jgi:hypothetical protein
VGGPVRPGEHAPGKRTTVAILLAAATFATGCGAAAERLTEAAAERAVSAASDGDVDFDTRNGQVTIESADGTLTSGATTEVPARIRELVDVPAGFEPATTFEQTEDGRQGVTVAGRLVTDDPAGVLDELGASLTTDGWQEANRTNLNGELLALALERDDDLFNLSMVVDGSETMLTMMLVEND